jgi:hypothetical protein
MGIGAKLWRKIERSQGYAYISDHVEDMPDEKVIEIAEAALIAARQVVVILEGFLKKYKK